jgi:hypothetical protein
MSEPGAAFELFYRAKLGGAVTVALGRAFSASNDDYVPVRLVKDEELWEALHDSNVADNVVEEMSAALSSAAGTYRMKESRWPSFAVAGRFWSRYGEPLS